MMWINNLFMKKTIFLFLFLWTYVISYADMTTCVEHLEQKKYNDAISCFEGIIKTYDKYSSTYELAKEWRFWGYYWLANSYLDKPFLPEAALGTMQLALSFAVNLEQTELANKAIDVINSYLEHERIKKTYWINDTFTHKQYYLGALNIFNAWGKVTKDNGVVVAVIDDWININHPDLKDSIWISPTFKYWDSKVIDFIGDNIGDNRATGSHGTMVSWIIWAISNNNEGISGIAKNVKIMPLRVFWLDGNAKEDDIIKALNFAIDNGANIINLSLWGSQFRYSDKYDTVIKRAYDNGIVVVIAAGNGDEYSKKQVWLDLKNNPISPVCNNNGDMRYSIGVAAYDKEGYRTAWTNYNSCIQFFAPGEQILSTSIFSDSDEYWMNYEEANGTSFSAPIISGIIALWFNQYWFIPPDIIQTSLQESLVRNNVWNSIIDAAKYLDILKKQSKIIQKTQQTRSKTINTISDADILADFGIITKKETLAEYRLDNNVLRQEVIGMAIKLAGITPPAEYTCKNTFRDVSAVKPNNWVCRAVEMGVENGIVSGANKNFNPESNITRAEALAILMKAAGIKIQEWENSKYADVTVSWQINIVNTAFSYSFIDTATNFYPNKNATRWEIFNMAKRILKSKS